MEQCTVKVKRRSKLSGDMLRQYYEMVDKVVRNIKDRWASMDTPLHMDLTFDVYVHRTLFNNLENIKTIFKGSNYTIRESHNNNKQKYCALKPRICTDKFSADVRIPIHLSFY